MWVTTELNSTQLVSPDGRCLAVAIGRGSRSRDELSLFDLQNWRAIDHKQLDNPAPLRVGRLAWLADSSSLVGLKYRPSEHPGIA